MSERKKFYRLRWRFQFLNKPDRVGVWNLISDNPDDAAWRVPKEGLVRAAIEGEDRETFEEKVLLEVFGDDYVSCTGEMFARMPGMGFQGSHVTPQAHLYGVSFLTRTEKITVHVDGSTERRPLTEEEKQFKLHEHIVGA
jgi:hypothetical protein